MSLAEAAEESVPQRAMNKRAEAAYRMYLGMGNITSVTNSFSDSTSFCRRLEYSANVNNKAEVGN